MRALTYCRYSTDRQTEASILDQQRRCHEYAASRGWAVSADYTDQGISGAALGNRPGVQAVLADVRGGDVLLVADLSRLSRSQELAPLIDRLRYRGVRIIGVLDGYDSDSPQARMQAGLSGIMSDELRASIRARTHSALHMRASQARPTGGKAYGFDSGGQPIETEAVVVREIFARFAAGESMKAIASDLNIRDIASAGARWQRKVRRRDGRWLVSALHAILRNERYIGRVVWNRSTWVKNPDTGLRERRERPEAAWVVHDGPALIEPRIWEMVRARLHERAAVTGSGKRRYMLSGLLVCRTCSHHLIVSGAGGARYVCGTHKAGGPAACPVSQSAIRTVAEDIILAPVREDLLSPAAVDRAVSLIEAAERAPIQMDGPELARIVQEIEDVEALIAERPSRSASLAPSLEALRARRLTLQQRAWRRPSTTRRSENVDEYVRAVRDLRETLSAANPDVARAALRSILGEIPVWPQDQHLMAQVRLNPVALLPVSWRGSGGVLWHQESRILALRRAA